MQDNQDYPVATAMLSKNVIQLDKVKERFQLEMQQIHNSCLKLSGLYKLK